MEKLISAVANILINTGRYEDEEDRAVQDAKIILTAMKLGEFKMSDGTQEPQTPLQIIKVRLAELWSEAHLGNYNATIARLTEVIELQADALSIAADKIGRCMCSKDPHWRETREALTQTAQLLKGGG